MRASTPDWADFHAAHHRESLRAFVEICETIREMLLLMGLDPTLAVSLRHGKEAAAELAAIPDTEALRAADEAITRDDQPDARMGVPRVPKLRPSVAAMNEPIVFYRPEQCFFRRRAIRGSGRTRSGSNAPAGSHLISLYRRCSARARPRKTIYDLSS